MPDYAASSVALALEELALLRHNFGSWSGPDRGLFGPGAGSRWRNDPVIPIVDYIQSVRFGALSPYVEPYITLVLNKGYKPATILGQLRLIARLNRWLLRMDYDLGRLDERVLEHWLGAR